MSDISKTTANPRHGRVRSRPGWGLNGETEIGVSLGGTEYILSVEDALGLANAIILTSVDCEQRHMRDPINAYLAMETADGK